MVLSEIELIQEIRARAFSFHRGLVKGIGDDCAVFENESAGDVFLCSTDLLIEHVHFNLQYTSLELLGKKSLAINLSDIAAMGGTSLYYVLSLATQKRGASRTIHELHKGLRSLEKDFRVTLMGGDLSHSRTDLFISITIVGKATKGKVIYRSGAKPGDKIFVTGTIGGSATGLHLLQKGHRLPRAKGSIRKAILAHLDPQPRCHIGKWLADNNFPSAMIDLSDGLSTDLLNLCWASDVGAIINESNLPVSPFTLALDSQPLNSAISGGEDYELLFTVPARLAKALIQRYPRSKFPAITEVGTIVEKKGGIKLVDQHGKMLAMKPLGYDHFSY